MRFAAIRCVTASARVRFTVVRGSSARAVLGCASPVASLSADISSSPSSAAGAAPSLDALAAAAAAVADAPGVVAAVASAGGWGGGPSATAAAAGAAPAARRDAVDEPRARRGRSAALPSPRRRPLPVAVLGRGGIVGDAGGCCASCCNDAARPRASPAADDSPPRASFADGRAPAGEPSRSRGSVEPERTPRTFSRAGVARRWRRGRSGLSSSLSVVDETPESPDEDVSLGLRAPPVRRDGVARAPVGGVPSRRVP